jgi:outer membrane protein OmpA-like peptidoglycan-associated protein
MRFFKCFCILLACAALVSGCARADRYHQVGDSFEGSLENFHNPDTALDYEDGSVVVYNVAPTDSQKSKRPDGGYQANESVDVYVDPTADLVLTPPSSLQGDSQQSNSVALFENDFNDQITLIAPQSALDAPDNSFEGAKEAIKDVPQKESVIWNADKKSDYGTADEVLTLYFPYGSTTPQDDIDNILGNIRAQQDSIRMILVEGHASKQAEPEAAAEKDVINLDMSLKRSLTVASAMIRGGVEADLIQTIGWGDQFAGDQDQDRDRRVDIKIFHH